MRSPGSDEADQAAAVGGHEVDRLGRGHLGGDHEVALVLAVLVVDEDEHAAVAGVVDDLFDRRNRVAPVVFHGSGGLVIHGARHSGWPVPWPEAAGVRERQGK